MIADAVKQIFSDHNFHDYLKQGGLNYLLPTLLIGDAFSSNSLLLLCLPLLVAKQEIRQNELNFVVPTGNFGNILAIVCQRNGFTVEKLICASNTNKVLTDFFHSGVYDINRPLVATISPSMDILISSNLERFLLKFEVIRVNLLSN